MKRVLPVLLTVLLCLTASWGHAAGISVDAGLQPAEDRWMIRTMAMNMRRGDDPMPMNREMDMVKLNTVLAYGLRRDLALIVKQPYLYREMTMSGTTTEKSGTGDLSVSAKYGLYRKNTADYTLGVSGLMGLEFPTGANAFTSDTWDLTPGLYGSYRSGAFASDLNIAYQWNGFADDGANGVNPGDELRVDAAVAYQLSPGNTSAYSIAPVVEFNFKHIFPDRQDGSNVTNSGETVFLLSPGLKLTTSHVILEGLVQVPVWQDQRGGQTERETSYILGARLMF